MNYIIKQIVSTISREISMAGFILLLLGKIPAKVRLRKEGDSFLFYVEDDGPGFDLQLVQRRSSGLKLVQGLARQLGGTFEVTTTPATRCIVRFQ
jgi:two-component sensor histidine kinase